MIKKIFSTVESQCRYRNIHRISIMTFLFLLTSAFPLFATFEASHLLPVGGDQNLSFSSVSPPIIKGTVTDVSGEPIIGASILLKSSTQQPAKGTVTDMNGTFMLEVKEHAPVVLIVSFVGMKNLEVTMEPNTPLTLVLEELSILVDEVVVTGYGTVKRSSYTGSASIVNMSDLQDNPAVSLAQILESKAPGVSISGVSGQPGSFQQIRIRGTGSFNASNEPLFVLDGVPIMSGNMTNDEDNPGGLDLFSTLNPADIESVTILKDATSTSLYGARGSNGVILITTKRGKEGKTKYSFKANLGSSDLAMQYRPIMQGEERRELIYEGYVNEYLRKGESEETAKAYADENIDRFAGIPVGGYADWQGALFKKGVLKNYEFSASGGKEQTRFVGSLGYTKSEGISLASDFERYTGKLSFSNTYRRFTLNMSSFFTLTENNMTPESYFYASALYSSRRELTPSIPIYKEDGSYNHGFYTNNGGYNPLFEDANSESFTRIGRLIGSTSILYRLMDHFNLSSNFNVDYTNTKEFRYWGPESFDGRSTGGVGQLWRPEILQYNSTSMINYKQLFDEKHNVDATAAFEVVSFNTEMLYGRAHTFGQKANHKLSNATTPVKIYNYEDNERLLSYVGRLNYDYDNRYYLSSSFRRDGSSRFSDKQRWANFWSLSGSWRVSSERFMRGVSHWLSDMKLKASYGVNGTLPSLFYGYQGTFSTAGQYGARSAIYEFQAANKNLTWEKGYMQNYGLELLLFGRVSLAADWYRRDTRDLLMNRPLYSPTGFLSVLDNVGHLRNQGVELEIISQNIDRKDFRWSTTLNFSSNRSKIIQTTADHTEFVDGRIIQREGQAINTIYVFEYAGVDPDNGLAQYYENRLLEDGTLSREILNDPNRVYRICAKDADPRWRGSFSNSLTYLFMDLSFNLSFTLGGWSVDGGLWALQDDGRWDRYNKSIELRRRWKNPGDVTDVPRYVNGYIHGGWYTSTRAVHSTNHLRLKSLTFGLSAPSQWAKPLGIDRARLFFSGNNLLTWAVYDQYDPELGPQVNWNVPPLRTLSFGLELSF